MKEFLTKDPIKLNDEELHDLQKRKDMDEKRVEEQKKFYEIARQRAKELDVYMERFRRDIVESSMFFPDGKIYQVLMTAPRRPHKVVRRGSREG